ncbi:hypothetical protein VTN77DRAFT_72 [Rasamsonia byssochlamydoides]|uniref:uncharacterized protein n=1 Tax=Rasamsonia byssochlamydoides TaxID=89139 RepID=UPI003743AC01
MALIKALEPVRNRTRLGRHVPAPMAPGHVTDATEVDFALAAGLKETLGHTAERLAASITAWPARSTGQKISGRRRTEQPVFSSPQSEGL